MIVVRNSRWWLALAPSMVVPFAASFFYFVLFSEQPFARGIYAATKVFTVVWPLVCIPFLLNEKLPRIDFRASKHLQAVPLGILTGILMAGLMFVAMKTPLGGVVLEGARNIRGKMTQLGILEHYWTFAIFLSVIHSLIEEYYWRWFVYGHLRRLTGIMPALILGSAAFASHHVVILSEYFPMTWALLFGTGVGIGGAIWCMMFERQRTVMGAWVSHLIVDFAIMTIGYGILAADLHG